MWRPPTTILAYHAVGPVPSSGDSLGLFVTTDVFHEQMTFLARHRSVVTLGEAARDRSTSSRPSVAITFDDGYRCLSQHAFPVLERYGFPATLFVPTGRIGDRNRWDTNVTTGLEIMSAQELQEAGERGFDVESHGHQHINLATATAGSAREDLQHSIAVLQNLLGHTPTFLAYPWGQATPGVEEIAKELGFRAAFTIGTRSHGDFARARVPVFPGDGVARLRLKSGGYWPAMRFSRAGAPIRRVGRLVRAQRRSQDS